MDSSSHACAGDPASWRKDVVATRNREAAALTHHAVLLSCTCNVVTSALVGGKSLQGYVPCVVPMSLWVDDFTTLTTHMKPASKNSCPTFMLLIKQLVAAAQPSNHDQGAIILQLLESIYTADIAQRAVTYREDMRKIGKRCRDLQAAGQLSFVPAHGVCAAMLAALA